jgi:hypothetical protein
VVNVLRRKGNFLLEKKYMSGGKFLDKKIYILQKKIPFQASAPFHPSPSRRSADTRLRFGMASAAKQLEH